MPGGSWKADTAVESLGSDARAQERAVGPGRGQGQPVQSLEVEASVGRHTGVNWRGHFKAFSWGRSRECKGQVREVRAQLHPAAPGAR